MAAIRFVAGQLVAGQAAPSAPDLDDTDIAQLGTSFRDPRRIVSAPSSFPYAMDAVRKHDVCKSYLSDSVFLDLHDGTHLTGRWLVSRGGTGESLSAFDLSSA